MFDISVDQYIFVGKKTNKSTTRRQIDTALDNLNEKDLIIVDGTVKGIYAANKQTKE